RPTVSTVGFTSSIGESWKGTNMSRFTEQLQEFHQKGFFINVKALKSFTKGLAERLDQKDAEIKVSFPWFYERRGPQCGLSGMNHADVSIEVNYDTVAGFTVNASLSSLITTLCPCSKEISEYSAHNQRGEVRMTVS